MKARPVRSKTTAGWPTPVAEFFDVAPKAINGKGFSFKMGTLREYHDIHISPEWEYENYFTGAEVNLLEELEAGDFFTDKDELDDFRSRFVPMFIESMDDSWSFNAFLIDITDPKLPVFVFGWETEGAVSQKADSLVEFARTYLKIGLSGAQPAPSSDPGGELRTLYKKLSGLLKKKKYDQVIELGNEYCQTYPEYLKPDIRERMDVDHSGLVGGFFNLLGIAHYNGGDRMQAISFYEKARALGDSSSMLNLAELYCYTAGEYEKARTLSRTPVHGDEPWFYKVKVDAYASLMLDDLEQSAKCYRLLHDRYLWADANKIAITRDELEDLGTPQAREILSWFGLRPEVSGQDAARNRKWWDGLEKNWQKQLREQLPGKATAKELSDDQISYFLNMSEFTMDTSYQVTSLEPLLDLPKLTALELYYIDEWESVIKDLPRVGAITGLESLQLESLGITHLNFISDLTKLRVLDTGAFLGCNAINDIAGVRDMKELEVLKIRGAAIDHYDGKEEHTLRDLSPLEGLNKLRDLEITGANVLDDSSLRNLSQLEELRVGRAGFETIEFIGTLAKLRELELDGCENLTSIAPLANLQNLERLELESCPITDVSIIGKLKRLKKLKLRHIDAKNLDFLAELSEIEDLELSYTGVADIGFMGKLPELKFIKVFETSSKFTGLSGLYDLPNLKRIEFQKKSIKEGSKAIREFTNRRPEVTFRH